MTICQCMFKLGTAFNIVSSQNSPPRIPIKKSDSISPEPETIKAQFSEQVELPGRAWGEAGLPRGWGGSAVRCA